MATLVLSAVGASVGAGFGGAVLGLSGMVIGRAVGATLGRAIDQSLLGSGSDAVERGRIERLRVTGAADGAPVPRVWGRVRLGGQVIWSSDFAEQVTTSGGGGKLVSRPEVREYSYTISLAVALCEGPVLGVGRIWADGQEIAPADLNLRVYSGTEDQLPDPLIEAVEGAGRAPAYRGIAYVVIEDLALERFGNRVPQLAFEVMRAADTPAPESFADNVSGVALMPGTGDFTYETAPVYARDTAPDAALAPGIAAVAAPADRPMNLNSPSGQTDIETGLDALTRELPGCGSVVMVVAWFGDDLRARDCVIEPKVEFADRVAPDAPWSVAGRGASDTPEVARRDGDPVYGGTPADRAVIGAIAALQARGQKVVYYPFILMEQLDGNARPDPYSDAPDQPVLPWRGRITTSVAPGRDASPDGTAAAAAEVADFFGTARAADFAVADGTVTYTGPDEWRYRRFILHQAALCAAAGGVDAFCIGSEMRGLTQIRGPANSFPAVAQLVALAGEVRALLGPDTTITYAADWSEYFGYITAAGDRFFHLDPLWADPNIDVIGIDNYMPLSDWRDGTDHADAGWGSVHDLGYLTANVTGGEGYDWFYATDRDRARQNRTPIRDDSAWGEDWIWRFKDLRGWWENDHHDRVGGVRAAEPTAWVPRSKPFWFTEYGCPAIDRGTNQPNVFVDPKSSESAVPHFSRGWRDDTIQMQYVRAVNAYWAQPAHNPVSEIYGGPMVDMTRAHLWAWDARPYPWFPGNRDLWADGANWARGHWVTGRATHQPLDAVIAEICARAGLGAVDVSGVHGVVRGLATASTEPPRAVLQALMLAHGLDAAERDGVLRFRMRDGQADAALATGQLARPGDDAGTLTRIRAAPAAQPARVRLDYVTEGGDFDLRTAEVVHPDATDPTGAAGSDLPLVLPDPEARLIAARWLAETRVARDTARFALAPSTALGAGDVVTLDAGAGPARWRIDRAALTGPLEVEATRVEPGVYAHGPTGADGARPAGHAPPAPVQPVVLDLPLIPGAEAPQAPWLALSARAWPGTVAVHRRTGADSYALERLVARPARLGVTQGALAAAPPGRWDRGAALTVRMLRGTPASASPADVLGGANLAAIGHDGAWEVFQFAEAALVAPDTYALRTRLRGQQGTDADMPPEWPAGALVVLLDGGIAQLDVTLDALGVARDYLVGPAGRPLDDPAQRDLTVTPRGVGLRPYRPAHLRARHLPGGDIALGWVRRTRQGGDSWNRADVPLAEAYERYQLRVLQGTQLLRAATLESPGWVYTAAQQAADGAAPGVAVEVAQISDSYGPGPAARIAVAP